MRITILYSSPISLLRHKEEWRALIDAFPEHLYRHVRSAPRWQARLLASETDIFILFRPKTPLPIDSLFGKPFRVGDTLMQLDTNRVSVVVAYDITQYYTKLVRKERCNATSS
jgi:hypothetical protein